MLYTHSLKKSLQQRHSVPLFVKCAGIQETEQNCLMILSRAGITAGSNLSNLFQVKKTGKWLSDIGCKLMPFYFGFHILLFSAPCSRLRQYLGTMSISISIKPYLLANEKD